MDTSEEYGAPVSNLPPLAWLSGLNLGTAGGLSGEQQPSLGGGAQGTQMPGMEGGLGLDALSELLKAQSAGGETPGVPGNMLQGIGGTIGQGTLAQGGPGYAIAGGNLAQSPQQQTGQQGYTAGQSQGGGIDPMDIIRRALGLTQKGVSIAQQAGQTEGYQTAGDTGQGGDLGQINPSGYSLTGPGAAPEGSPESLAQFFSGEFGGRSLLNDPMLMELFTSGKLTGSLTPSNIADFGSLGGSQLGGYRTALSEGTIGPSLGEEMSMAAPGGSAGFSLGGNTALDTSLGGGLPPTDIGGALQGGIGGALGLLNLLQGLESGNLKQGIGGGLQGIGGLSALLQSSPELANALGLSGGTLGAAGAGIGGLGGLLGLASGIEGLTSGDANPFSAATQLGGGALSTYGALQSLSVAYPALFGGQALPPLTGVLGGLLGAGGGAAAGLGAGATLASPAVAAGLGIAPAASGAAAGAGAATGATVGGSLTGAAALAPLMAIAYPLIQGLTDYFGNPSTEELGSWKNIGGRATALKEQGEQFGGQANQLFQQAQQAGVTDPRALQELLGFGANSLFPFYQQLGGSGQTARGSGTNPFGAGAYFKATGEDPAAYQATQQQLLNNIYRTTQQLKGMGITNEQLGQINVNPQWGETYLGGTPVAANRPAPGDATYAQTPGAAAFTDRGWLSPTNTNLATGGPLMSMLAYLNPSLYGQIGGGFNYGSPGAQEELAQQRAYMEQINQQAGVAVDPRTMYGYTPPPPAPWSWEEGGSNV